MGKAGKILIFVFVMIVLAVIGTGLKEAGTGPFFSIGGVALLLLGRSLFKKQSDDDKD